MKNFKILIFLYLLSFSTFCQTSEKKIDELLNIYQKANEFNGNALVSYKGNVLLNKGYGFKNVANSTFRL